LQGHTGTTPRKVLSAYILDVLDAPLRVLRSASVACGRFGVPRMLKEFSSTDANKRFFHGGFFLAGQKLDARAGWLAFITQEAVALRRTGGVAVDVFSARYTKCAPPYLVQDDMIRVLTNA
jgi:hypothetical protein